MKLRPELQALRCDDAPQRLVQARLAEATLGWAQASGLAKAEAELARLSAGAELEDLPTLAGLFTPGDPAARDLVEGLVEVQAAQLRDQPLGQVTLRHSIDEATSVLSLARSGTAALTLQAVDGAALARRERVQTAGFSPTETWSRVIAGKADAEIVRIVSERPGGAELRCEPVQLMPETISHRLGASEVLQLRSIPTSLVTLTLQRRIGEGAVRREFLLSDGTLVHQAAGSPRDSRIELSLALLGRMGRSDAAPLLAVMAEEEAALSLRWQALRECLGLDTATGFATLERIARREADPLAAAAGALRAQLLETYPQLADVAREDQPCLG
jgi:hypothetical protein